MSQLSQALDVYTKEGTLKAIMLAVAGWTAFAITDTLSKWLTQTYTVAEIVSVSSALGTILSFFWIFFRYGHAAFFPANLKWHIIRSLCLSFSVAVIVNAPFHYSQILWGVLFGFLFFKDIPGTETVIGAFVIIAAGIYLVWRENLPREIPFEQPLV